MFLKFSYLLFKFLLFSLVTIFLLLVAVYFGLQSSLVEKKVIPYLQPLIKEKSGFDVQMERFHFDLFGHLSLDNLLVKKFDTDNNQTIKIGIKRLNLRYDFWKLFNKNILIKELSLDGVTLYAHLPLQKASKQKPQNDGNSTYSKKQLVELIGKPPVIFALHSFHIKPINIDLHLYNKEQKIDYKGKVTCNGVVKWNNSGLDGMLGLNMHNSTIAFIKNATDKTKLLIHPMIDTQIKWQLKKDKETLLLELKPTQVTLTSGKTTLSYFKQDKKIAVALDAWKFQLNLKGESRPFQPLGTHLQWRLQQDLHASNTYFEQNSTSIHINPLELHCNLQGSMNKIRNIQNQFIFNLQPVQVNLTQANSSLQVTPDYHLHLDTQLALEHDKNSTTLNLRESQVRFTQDLNFKDLEIYQDKNRLSIAQEKWQLKEKFVKNQFIVESNLSIKELNTTYALQTFSVNNQLSLVLDPKLRDTKFTTMLTLDKLQPLLNLSLTIDNAPKNLQLHPFIVFNIPQSLDSYFREAKPLRKLGDINVSLNANVQITHNKENALDVNWSQYYKKMPFISNVNLTLKQLHAPTEGSLRINGVLKTKLFLSRNKLAEYQSDISLKSRGLLYPPLQKPLPLTLRIQTSSNKSFHNIHSKANIAINNQPFIKYNLHIIDKPQNFSLKSLWNIHTDTQWKSYLSQLQALEKIGTMHLQSQFDLNLIHPFKSVTLVKSSTLNGVQARVALNGSLKQEHYNKSAQIVMPKPLEFQHTLQWQEENASLNASYNIEDMKLINKIHLQKLLLGVRASVHDGKKPHAIIANIESNGSKVTLLSDKNSSTEMASLLLPLSLFVDAKLNKDANTLDLKKLQLSLGNGWLKQNLSGFSSLDGKNSDITGNTLLQPRSQLFKAPLPPLSGSGKLTIPWHIRVSKSQYLALKSEMIFDDLSLQSKQASLSNINGRFHINEELLLGKDKNVSFEYLLKTDPFQRVDFNQIEPYLYKQERFSIETVKVGNTSIGPMQVMMPIDQNLIQLKQFNLKLFGGYIVGKLYLNTAPKNWSFGLLMRLTQVDLRKALKKNSNHFKASPVSARVALEFDFSKRLLQGRIDITDISKSQLLQLLELLDPGHKDTQINQVREALRYAHPESVVMTMDGGLLDLNVSLSLTHNPIIIRGLPLSPLIEKYAGNILNQMNQLPLK